MVFLELTVGTQFTMFFFTGYLEQKFSPQCVGVSKPFFPDIRNAKVKPEQTAHTTRKRSRIQPYDRAGMLWPCSSLEEMAHTATVFQGFAACVGH
jgi:hypothetical protein